MRPFLRVVCAGVGVCLFGCVGFPVVKDAPYTDTPLLQEATECAAVKDPSLAEFYRTFQPRRGFYFFELFRSNGSNGPATLYIVRATEQLPEKGEPKKSITLPAVEKIIGPISTPEDWQWVFAYLRRYASSPPAGNYCWADDCYGKFNVRTDGTGEFPRPGEDPPHVPPVTGYIVSQPGGYANSGDPGEAVVRYALLGGDPARVRYIVSPEVLEPTPLGAAPDSKCVSGRGEEVKATASKVLQVLSR